MAALAALAGRAVWLAVPAAAYPAFFAVIPAGPSNAAERAGGLAFAVALVLVLLRERPGAGTPKARPAGADRAFEGSD